MAGGGIGNVWDYPEPPEVWEPECPTMTCWKCGADVEVDDAGGYPCECGVMADEPF